MEAARAGEQGRGFAVVAGEVRTLAQRSAEAAKEIKDLIGDSVEKVESGSKLVNDAGQTMDEVVKSVKRVADIISAKRPQTHALTSFARIRGKRVIYPEIVAGHDPSPRRRTARKK